MGVIYIIAIIFLLIYWLNKKLKRKFLNIWIIGTSIIYLITGLCDYFYYRGMSGYTTGFMPVCSLFFSPLIIFCFTLFVFDFNKRK